MDNKQIVKRLMNLMLMLHNKEKNIERLISAVFGRDSIDLIGDEYNYLHILINDILGVEESDVLYDVIESVVKGETYEDKKYTIEMIIEEFGV